MSRHQSKWERIARRKGDRRTQQAQDAARKQKLLEQLKAKSTISTKTAEDETRHATITVHRDREAYMRALDDTRFYDLGASDPLRISDEYREIVGVAVTVADTSECKAVLLWPSESFSPSAVIGLMALGSIGSAPRVESTVAGVRSWSREKADPVRVAIFPYARSTHASARRVQVDAKQVGEVNFEHFMREVADQNDPARDYHHVISRVRSLDGRATDGAVYPEFRHPVLDEMVPHGPPFGSRMTNGSLLWRTHRKTDIGRLSRSGTADDPSLGQFYSFEMRASDRIGVPVRSIKSPLNLLLIDLTRTGRQRLGWNWGAKAREIVECTKQVHPTAGILAITDDPWVFSAARFDVLEPDPKLR